MGGTNQNTVLKNFVGEAPDSFCVETRKFPRGLCRSIKLGPNLGWVLELAREGGKFEMPSDQLAQEYYIVASYMRTLLPPESSQSSCGCIWVTTIAKWCDGYKVFDETAG